MERPVKRLVVVGGGIAGLAAAYYASRLFTDRRQVTLVEREDRWGGKIRTDRVDGFVLEAGPDTFIAAKPWAVDLCRELGIGERLRGTNPHKKNTYILRRGQLHPLPGGLSMMIPTRFGDLVRSGLISWPGKLRMGLDVLLPPANWSSSEDDESIGEFVTRRLGREAYEALIEPLMSGIYAGDGDSLSLLSTFPYLRELEARHGSLVRGALAARARQPKNGKGPASGSRSLFLTPLSGLGEIVETLVEVLEERETGMIIGNGARHLERVEGGYRLELEDGSCLEAEAVILATPAYISANLLAGVAPGLAGELRAIEYATTATVSLGYEESDLPRPLDGYGYAIPRREGRKALACTWTSTKFPHRAPAGKALLRVFIGRAGQEDIAWDEASLEEIAREELRETLGITARPLLTRVTVWERAMPQYTLGHAARLDRINAGLAGLPGLALAGNGYRGIGIPDCIRSGARAVEQLTGVTIG